jgi:hypothetical protein
VKSAENPSWIAFALDELGAIRSDEYEEVIAK